jgi:hypothetical protein
MQTNILEKKSGSVFFIFISFIFDQGKKLSDNLETHSVEDEGGTATHILFHLPKNAFQNKKGHH